MLETFSSRLLRTKTVAKGDLSTNLRRCLNTFDITMLGVGHMIGAGIYVSSGEVMRNITGPSTILAYFVAGMAALLSALCYAEFGARYPKAGSAYTYAYVGCGEIWAFVIGWNIILEYVLCAAAGGRLFADNLDDFMGFPVRDWTIENARVWPWNRLEIPHYSPVGQAPEICLVSNTSLIMNRPILGYYPDFISPATIIFSALFVAVGSRVTSNFNSIFSIGNLIVIFGVVGYGLTFANFNNWKNFFPCGVNGVLAGASKCFFTYIGFDGLATAGEEAINPAKMIPRATYLSMGIVTTCYMLMAGTLSLMLPYTQLSQSSVYSAAFVSRGAPEWISAVIAIGSMLGILTTTVGGLFSLPRAVYAMAEDGLLFEWWAAVNQRTRTPLNATITFTLLAALIAMSFDIGALVDFLSIGTIMAYTIVAAALILLRYRPQPSIANPDKMDLGGRFRKNIPLLSKIFKSTEPGSSILYSVLLMMVTFTGIGVIISNSYFNTTLGLILLIILASVSLCTVLFIDAHHQNSMDLEYKVFLVPYLPSASLLINIIMMTQLTGMTWVRLAVWMTIGLSIYFVYGIHNSKEEKERRSMSSGAVHASCANDWNVADFTLKKSQTQ